MTGSEVKLGNRVVYSDGANEFEGVATSDAMLGVHPGRKRANYYVNLAYVNTLGELVKVMGAALLTSAASEDEHAKIATMEFAARTRNAQSASAMVSKQMTADDVLAELQANPETIGWRPKADGEDVAKLEAVVEALQGQLTETANDLVLALAENEKLQALLNQDPEPAPQTLPAEALPSAADLDAVAAEQTAAQSTGAPEEDVVALLQQAADATGTGYRSGDADNASVADESGS